MKAKNNIQIFNNTEFGTIRTIMDERGMPWFVGRDVAAALGYANTADAIRKHVCEEDKLPAQIAMAGQRRQVILINESGLYALVLSSKLESAQRFKRWVTSEVLPQIRQTGGYIPVQEGDTEQDILARGLIIAQRRIEQMKQQLTEQRPLVEFAHAVSACDNAILIRELAKLITQNGVEIGQARLFYWLRLHEYIFKRSTAPIQHWVERGIFQTQVSVVQTPHGRLERITTRVTPKGQRYFLEGFLSGRFRATNKDFINEFPEE